MLTWTASPAQATYGHIDLVAIYTTVPWLNCVVLAAGFHSPALCFLLKIMPHRVFCEAMSQMGKMYDNHEYRIAVVVEVVK